MIRLSVDRVCLPSSPVPARVWSQKPRIYPGSMRLFSITNRCRGDATPVKTEVTLSAPSSAPHETQHSSSQTFQQRPLEALPFSGLVRSFLVLSVATLPPSILLMLVKVAKTNASLFERSGIIRWVVRNTFYKHFCIGATRSEIMSNVIGLRRTGVSGIVLTYAKEAAASSPDAVARKLAHGDVDLFNWVDNNLQTIEMLEAGDYIALRTTGAGPASCGFLERYTKACTTDSGSLDSIDNIEATLKQEYSILEDSMRQLCAKAHSKGIRILIDAEGSRYQRAIDQISLNLMLEFNTNRNGRATVLNTYQLYLKSSIEKIKRHLQHSVRHNYLLGLKLVRGAYMYVEPNRDIIYDTKQGTDDSYDAAVNYLLTARADDLLGKGNWNADIVLATHNTPSVQKALRLYMSNANTREQIQGLSFAQLMGMADELSLSLAAQLRQTETISNKEQFTTSKQGSKPPNAKLPEVGIYKYTVWGTMSDCLLYMLRRAEENSDAVGRSRATVVEVLKELMRRIVFLGR